MHTWRTSLVLNARCIAFLVLIIGIETCEDPWKDHGGACFLFASKSKSFFHARDDCYSNGGILTSIRNATELNFIVKSIQKLGSAYQRVRWFTGLYQFDASAANNYRWMDGSLASFRYWMRSQPNNPYERCVQLDGSAGFKWRDDICNQPALYICRKEKGAVDCYDKPKTSYIWKALDMSVTLCIEHCRGRGYPSAAVKPDRCFCMTEKDAEKGTVIDLAKCSSLCEEQHCGLNDALAVYNISFYPDIARSCEELTAYGIYHPASYILAKNGENPKKYSCFGHEEEPIEEPTTTEAASTTEEPTTTTKTTTTTTTKATTTTTTLQPTTTTTTTLETTTTTAEPSSTTTTLHPTTTTTTLQPTTTTTTSQPTTVTTTTTSQPTTTTTTLQPSTTTTTLQPTTTTTTQPTTTTTLAPTEPPADTKYKSTTDIHFSDLIKNSKSVNPNSPPGSINGPVGFGWGANFTKNLENEDICLKFDNFQSQDEKCWLNPLYCVHGISISLWAKISYIRTDDVPRFILSTGGFDDGTPGISMFYKGIYLYGVVCTGNETWVAFGAGLTRNYTWNNIGIVWSRSKGLSLYVNSKRVAYVVYPEKSVAKESIVPPLLTIGCRRNDTSTFIGYSYGEYDELAIWRKALDDENIDYFLGGTACDPDLHPLSCETNTELLLNKFNEVNLSDPIALGKSLKHLNKVSAILKQSSSSSDNLTLAEKSQREEKDGKKSKTLKNLVKLLKKILKSTADSSEKKFSQTKSIIQEVESLLSNLFSLSEIDSWKDFQKNDEESTKLVNDYHNWLMKKLTHANYANKPIDEDFTSDNIVTSLKKMKFSELMEENGKYIYYPNYYNQSDVEIMWNDTIDYIRIPTAIFKVKNDSNISILSTIYDTFHKIAPLQNSITGRDTDLVYLDSRVINYFVNPYDKSFLLNDPIVVYLEHEQNRILSRLSDENTEIIPKSRIHKRFCVRWDPVLKFKRSPSLGGWNTEGCEEVFSRDESTKCLCKDLGMFAILTILEKPNLYLLEDYMPESQWLRIIKWIGYEISGVLLIIYIFLIIIRKSLHDQFHLIRLNTSIAALAALISFFCIDFKWQDKASCRVLSGFAHFFYMALATWLVMEAHALFAAIIMGAVGGRIICYILIGWGIPAILLGTFIGMYSNYGEDYRCLAGPTTDMRWSFVGPILGIAGLALLWSMITICNLNTPAITVGAAVEELGAATRGLFSVSFVFEVTWVFGKLAFVDINLHHTHSFDYLFQILNSFLGVFIVFLMGFGSRHFRYGAITSTLPDLQSPVRRNQVAPIGSPCETPDQDGYSKTFLG